MQASTSQRKRVRAPVVRRFKGFDDDDDDVPTPITQHDSSLPGSHEQSGGRTQQSAVSCHLQDRGFN